MKTSQHGLDLIKKHEGFRSTAYPDPGSRDGKPWTIGYGHTRGVRKGMVITKTQATSFLRTDLKTAENAVNNAVKVGLNQNQFDALVSFVFNVGVGAFKRSTLLKRLNAKNYTGAAEQFARWNKNDGRVMKGLVKRRKAEAALFNLPKVTRHGKRTPDRSKRVRMPTNSKGLVPFLLAAAAAVIAFILKQTGAF
jgi:lysozyme